MTTHSILWRSLHLPGHEACRLDSVNAGWVLAGTAVFSYEQQPCRLDYEIDCDSGWNTRSAKVNGWLADRLVAIDIIVSPERQWRLNGIERPEVAGCIDLDLNFSPVTNMLPIRRLDLAIGQAAQVKAAWLRFPSFELEALPQEYRRLDESTYRYASAEGQFVADLQASPAGFVTNYPGFWLAEAFT